MSGRFAEYAGGIVEPGTPIVLVAEPGLEVEARNRLARVGFDSVVGHLVGAVEPSLEAVSSSRLDVAGLEKAAATVDGLQLVDVRQPGETANGTIEGAILIPLTELNTRLDELDPSRPTVVYCAGGFRSMIAGSRLENAGFGDVSDLLGGYGAWETAGSAA